MTLDLTHLRALLEEAHRRADVLLAERDRLAARVAKLEEVLLLARDALDDMMGDTDIEEDDSKAFTAMQTIADVL